MFDFGFNNINKSSQIIIEESRKMGIKVEEIEADKIYLLSKKEIKQIVSIDLFFRTTAHANRVCLHKDTTKMFLSRSGISVADGKTFKNNQISQAAEYCNELKWDVVVKPVSYSQQGEGVHTQVASNKDLKKIWDKQNPEAKYLIEKKFVGKEYRLLATKNKFIAAIHRMPANVVGDGETSIAELIERKNKEEKRSDNPSDPRVKISIDASAKIFMKKNNLSLRYVPVKGKRVYLRGNSNISTGGDSVDYTDKIHKSVKKIAVESVRSIPGLFWGGVDIITSDITKKQAKGRYIVVEINSDPGIGMHHFPCYGKPRNVAREILLEVFKNS